MSLLNIAQLNRSLILLMLFFLILPLRVTSTEKSAPPHDCLKCHDEMRQDEMSKKYIHSPFLEKNCIGCHVADDDHSSPQKPLISSSGDESKNWRGKNLVPATSHWFEFKSAENSSSMILEASYGSKIRSYREILLPPLDSLTEVANVFGRNPPRISNVKVTEVKKGIFLSATISWQTARPTSGRITYGIVDLQQTTPLTGQLRSEHLETLSDLKPRQTYQFKITAEDTVGNRTESDVFKFSTDTTFSNPITQYCCLSKPLGLESNFFRNGDRYLVNITAALPVKLFFGLLKADCSIPEAPNKPEPLDTLDNQSQTNNHIILSGEEAVTFIVCKHCHQDDLCSHPVNVYPKKGTTVPPDYPTMADGRIGCISCHAPHASDFQYRLIKDHRQELCIGCHKSFFPTGNNLLSRKYL